MDQRNGSKVASNLWIIKLWYFMYLGACASIGPYMNLYFARIGITKEQIGIIGAIRPMVSASAGSGWSMLADRFQAYRTIFLTSFVVSTFCRVTLILPWVHVFGKLLGIILFCDVLSVPTMIMADTAVLATIKQDSDYGKQRLWGAAGWGIASAFVGGIIHKYNINFAFYCYFVFCVITFIPSLLISFQPLYERHAKRLHKIVSARSASRSLAERNAATVITNGHTCGISQHIDTATNHDLNDLATPLLDSDHEPLANGITSQPITEPQLSNATSAEESVHPNILKGLGLLFSSPEAIPFFLTAILMGYGIGVIEGYLFLYLDQLGGSEQLMGMTIFIACSSEVPLFAVSGRLINWFGINTILNLVLLAYVVRCVCYATLSSWGNVWFVLPVELLHGLTFACAWAAGTVKSGRIAPPGMEATAQGIFNTMYAGLGYGLGGLAGGLIYGTFGPKTLFTSTAVVMFSGWVVISVLRWVLKHVCHQRESVPLDIVTLDSASLQ